MREEHILRVSEYLDNEDFIAIEKILEELKNVEKEKDYDYWLLSAMIARRNHSDDRLFENIINGMRAEPMGYEMYNYLGDYYMSRNKNKAYLCYEMAWFYCHNEESTILEEKLARLREDNSMVVKPVSVVIPSYNCKEMMKNCIDSIRQTNPKSAYEIVVVDNASTDGILEWLKEQEDIVLIANESNTGFPIACNQGINVAKKENDIFLLNNDTLVPVNAIFWLRMGLYESEKVGATGSVSNHVTNYQKVDVVYENVQDYLDWAYTNNILSANPYEKKLFLIGFALMMKRTVLDKIGLLDERFSPGNYEDNDIGFRINEAGYQVLLCKNSFILHYGHTSFKKDPEEFGKLLKRNREYFARKWGMEFDYYIGIRTDILSVIQETADKPIKVLEVGCGAGATLARLKYMYPNATVKGIELNESVARMAGCYLDVVQGNIETMDLDFEKDYFDYVIFGDVLEHLTDPLAAVLKIKQYMKVGGRIVSSIPNLLNATVMMPLLKGVFKYEDVGLLNKTHCHLFTKTEGIRLFLRGGFELERIVSTVIPMTLSKEEMELYEAVLKLPGVVPKEEFEAYQYIYIARKN